MDNLYVLPLMHWPLQAPKLNNIILYLNCKRGSIKVLI